MDMSTDNITNTPKRFNNKVVKSNDNVVKVAKRMLFTTITDKNWLKKSNTQTIPQSEYADGLIMKLAMSL